MVNDTQPGKKEIEEILSQRHEQYSHATVKAALAQDRGGEWRNLITTVQFSDDMPGEPKHLVYPGFEIHEVRVTTEEVLSLVEDLVREKKLHIGGRNISLRDGRFYKSGDVQRIGQRVPGGAAWVLNEWPGDQYLFTAAREMSPPAEAFAGSDMPAYPDAYAAIEHIVGIDTRGSHTWDAGVFFFFPDYRARIQSITLGVESLSIRIDARRSTFGDLVGKVYARSKEGAVQHQDIEFHGPEERAQLGFRPERTYVWLLCKSDGQILDEWKYTSSRYSSKAGVELFAPEYVQKLAEQGEDESVEYKRGVMNDDIKREIAESAIAFSNKKGGVILVGVDNNSRIEGAYGDGWEDVIIQSLRDRCDPPVEPKVHRVVLEDKPVYLVQIAESDSKPHQMKGTGVFYIRVGATDKPATRYELSELFSRLTSGPGYPFYRY